jgi:hypothetical protein
VKELRYADADKCANEVSTEEGAWLGKRGIDGPIDEDRGGSITSYDGRYAPLDEVVRLTENSLDQRDSSKRANE